MHNSNLIQLLRTFNRKEMTRLKEFAYSPYHNKHEMVRHLIHYLSDEFPSLDTKNCDRALLGALLMGDEYSQEKLDHVFSYALKLAEAFLANEQFKEEDDLQQIYLLQKLRTKSHLKRYEKILKQSEKQLLKKPLRNHAFYHTQLLMATEGDDFYTQMARLGRDERLQEKEANLDLYYFTVKLMDACEMMVRRNFMSGDYTTQMTEEIAQHISENIQKYDSHPAVIIYYQIYQMLKNEADTYYFELIPLLDTQSQYFPIEEQKYVFQIAQNYCIQQINKGHPKFMRELFKLYQILLKNQLLLDDGLLSQWHYKNIVTVGLRLEEFEWTRSFIEDYKKLLDKEVFENAYNFNLASYYYSTQQLNDALELLISVEYTDLRYNLDAKSLLLRIYYDLEEDDALLSLIAAFKKFIQRNKLIADFRKRGYTQMVNFTHRLYKLKNKKEIEKKDKFKGQIEKLKEAIDEGEGIFNLNWLQQKVEELR